MYKKKTVGLSIRLSVFVLIFGSLAVVFAAAYDGGTPVAHSQEYTDTPPSLVAVFDDSSRYVFLDDSGHGVMAGMVENRSPDYLSSVYIQVKFFDKDTGSLVDVVSNSTLFDVLPPNSKTPFLIRSSAPDLNIAHASAKIIHVDSAPNKEYELNLQVGAVESFIANADQYNIAINAEIQNGPAPSSDVVVYVAFHDAFDPPRTLDVRTASLGDLRPDETVRFSLDEMIPLQSRSFSIFAESDVYHSEAIHRQKIDLPTSFDAASLYDRMLIASITDVSLRDGDDNRISSASIGDSISIKSTVSMQLAGSLDAGSNDDNIQYTPTPYVFYTQIKDASKSAQVEFIGRHDGQFVNQDEHILHTNWVPQNPGLYIAETFVWDENNVPLAARGPVLLVLVEEE